MLKKLRKGNNMIIGLVQQTMKKQCMYLPFKNLKVRSEIGQQCPES